MSRLTQTVNAFNTSVGTLESRVLVSARRMAEMRAMDAADLKEQELVEIAPRELQSVPAAETDDPHSSCAISSVLNTFTFRGVCEPAVSPFPSFPKLPSPHAHRAPFSVAASV